MEIFMRFEILALASIFALVKGDFTCQTPQYFEIGSDGTIACSFPRAFRGVYWYDSPDESANIIVFMETQNSDSFSRNGPGFLNGSYDITKEGYLIIRNVTHVHDRMFQALVVDEKHAVSNYVVVVITTHNREKKYPMIDACYIHNGIREYCIVSSIGIVVKCTYENSRPAASLTWYAQYPLQEEHSLKGNDSVHLDSKYTYKSVSTVDLSGIIRNPILVLTCTAQVPHIKTENLQSFVIVDGTNSSYTKWQSTERYDRYVYLHSREELTCNDVITYSSAYMWKWEANNSVEVLTYYMNYQSWLSKNLNGISFAKEGSLIFEKMTMDHEGIYTCVTVNNGKSSLSAINVIVLVPPKPPGIDVQGCPSVKKICKLYVNHNESTLVSCNVTLVKPEISLSIHTSNTSGVIILKQESFYGKDGDLFNAMAVAEVEIQDNTSCEYFVTCIASGPGLQSFDHQRTVSLIPDTCKFAVVSTVYIIPFSIAGAMLIVVFISFVCWNKRKLIVRTPDQRLPNAILKWPLGNVESLDIFYQEAIVMLREVSDEIEKNRKRKNLGVAGRSAAGIVGGGLAILGAGILPFTFGASSGLMLLGGVVGAAGAGMSIGFSLEKLFKDRKRRDIVQPALSEFINIQKELAKTVALISVVYDVLKDKSYLKNFRKTETGKKGEFQKVLKNVRSLYDVPNANIREKISTIYQFTTEMAKHFVGSHDQEKREEETKFATEVRSLMDREWHQQWQDKLDKAESSPFDVLENAVTVVIKNSPKCQKKFTFLRLVRALYVDGYPNVNISSTDKGKKGKKRAAPLVGATGRVVAAAAAGIDDAAKLGSNIAKIARGVTVAGVIVSAFGVAVDLVFLGHAVCDLFDKNKEEFSQALPDAADIMEEMNKVTKNVADNDGCCCCCC